MSTVDRFNAHVVITEDGCWEWTGTLNDQGYGIFTDEHKHRVRVHRWAKQHFDGLAPGPELVIDHLCHDPETCPGGDGCPHRRCVNPEHLAWVTSQQNQASGRTALSRSDVQKRRVETSRRNRLHPDLREAEDRELEARRRATLTHAELTAEVHRQAKQAAAEFGSYRL